MSRRSRSFNAFEQATTAAIDDAVTSIPLDSVTNLTPPGYLVIDPDDPLIREYIFYTTINALVLENVSRGLEGSAGGVPHEHSSGARVRAVSVHQWLDDLFDDIEDLEDGTAVIPTYLLLSGASAMAGNLDMGSTNRIVDMANGIADQDAATIKDVNNIADAGDLLLLDLAGSRIMTGNLTFNRIQPTIAMNSPDGSSEGYRIRSFVDDAVNSGLRFEDNVGTLLFEVRSSAAEAPTNIISNRIPVVVNAGVGDVLTLQSGDSTNDVDHCVIRFITDTDQGPSIVGQRGTSSTNQGMELRTLESNIERAALKLFPNGQVGVFGANGVGVNDMRVRNMVVTGTPTEQNVGDLWFNGKNIQYWAPGWTTIGTLN